MIEESDVIRAINAFTNFSCQTEDEADEKTNTDANILYNSQTKAQSNFKLMYAVALHQLDADEARYGVTLNDDQRLMALAYLIAYYHERKFKDWHATSIKSGDDSVTKTGSGYLASYNEVILNAVMKSNTIADGDLKLERHVDCENYPDKFRITQMKDEEIILSE